GTERARTKSSGSLCESVTSYAFGDGQAVTYANGCSADNSPLHFTGKERDPESGLDDFGARYYSSTQGRWFSPDWSADPKGIPYANIGNPQTLNLYGYVGNNPTSGIDASGHYSAHGSALSDGSLHLCGETCSTLVIDDMEAELDHT